jgi:hypothetical protein
MAVMMDYAFSKALQDAASELARQCGIQQSQQRAARGSPEPAKTDGKSSPKAASAKENVTNFDTLDAHDEPCSQIGSGFLHELGVLSPVQSPLSRSLSKQACMPAWSLQSGWLPLISGRANINALC